ncbi:radical SAM family heme chaperone HemW [Lachnospiraceae bacterium OttesenSCG-928-E19]|nr:radical SAM family heme chaperone HemW [Lachnospiraceae bacterium OttesenSCG-928-E19]
MKRELELYIHIPFCVKKCDYCDFLSMESVKEERSFYVDVLIREIETYQEMAKQYRVTTIFLGGGTPSILSTKEVREIISELYRTFEVDSDAEITMEINPGTVTKGKLRRYKACGINRLSIGAQSTSNSELKNLGRIHTYQMFEDAYRWAREVGFQNINVDLISAIPGQTKESWERTLSDVVNLTPRPEHISAYSLIIEEDTPFHEIYGEGKENSSFLPLPEEEEERRIYKTTKSFLAKEGYIQYEISNYAKPGYECRHNLGYWDRKEYLGLGLGAASLIGNTRFKNTASITEYHCGTEVQEWECLSSEECMEEFMFLGLRKTKGIEKELFYQKFGTDIEKIYGKEIEKLKQQKLIKESHDRISLTKKGVDVSNYALAEFIH